MPEELPASKALSAAERKRAEDDNKRWATIIAACKSTDYRLIEIPLVEILPCKSTHAVIGALNKFYARLRSWGLPIYRLHSDCAGEFTHSSLRQWATHRGIHVTTTMPESKASNGRAERLIGRLKQQIRALLSGHGLDPGLWPHAARYANESLQREALKALGHDTKPLIPFYSRVRFRSRSWRDTTWGSRATEGHLVAPCNDISRGYVIRVIDEGIIRFYSTTLVYQGDFMEPVPMPDVEAADALAAEVHPSRFEVGWPPPLGAGEIQTEGQVQDDEAAEAPKDETPSSSSPWAAPKYRARSKLKGEPASSLEGAKVSLLSQLDGMSCARVEDASWNRDQHAENLASVAEVLSPARSSVLAQASLSELRVQAQLLACVALEGLNRTRVTAVFQRAAELAVEPLQVHVRPEDAVEPLSSLVETLLHVIGVAPCPMTCYVFCAALQDILSCVHELPEPVSLLVPLHVPQHVGDLWMPLNRGSLLQGELAPQPGCDPVQAPLGQRCMLEAWHGLWLTGPAVCCAAPVSSSEQLLALLLVPTSQVSLPLPCQLSGGARAVPLVGLPSAPVGSQLAAGVCVTSRAAVPSVPGGTQLPAKVQAALPAVSPSAPVWTHVPPDVHDASRVARPYVSDVQVLLPSAQP